MPKREYLLFMCRNFADFLAFLLAMQDLARGSVHTKSVLLLSVGLEGEHVVFHLVRDIQLLNT